MDNGLTPSQCTNFLLLPETFSSLHRRRSINSPSVMGSYESTISARRSSPSLGGSVDHAEVYEFPTASRTTPAPLRARRSSSNRSASWQLFPVNIAPSMLNGEIGIHGGNEGRWMAATGPGAGARRTGSGTLQ